MTFAPLSEVRDNLKPNDFVTAMNVWNSINEPISLDMVINENATIEYDDNYYCNNLQIDMLKTRILHKNGFYIPNPDQIEYQSSLNKQGRAGEGAPGACWPRRSAMDQ